MVVRRAAPVAGGRAPQRRIRLGGLRANIPQTESRAELADYIGRFVAGELVAQYEHENLREVLDRLGPNALRLSWG